jgi:DNA-binding NarL/FixJ family response regulator
MIKVNLVDDHLVVRSGLRNILTDEKDISITGESSSSEDIIRQLSVDSNEVDLLVLDFVLPGMNGLEALSRIKKIRKNLNILMLSMYDDNELVFKSLKAGAAGYLSKESASKELALAVRKINDGDIYLGKSIKLRFKAHYDTISRTLGFSELDLKVMSLIASGKSIPQISKDLLVNDNSTLESMKKMYDKIKIHTNIELVHYALIHKFILPA